MKWTLVIGLCSLFSGGLRADPGKWFLVTFPQSYKPSWSSASGLQFLALEGGGVGAGVDVSVNVSTLPSSSSSSTPSSPITLKPGEVGFYNVGRDPSQLLPMGTLISNLTFEVVSSEPIELEVVNTIKSNGDIFSPIPVVNLGTEYYAAGGPRSTSITASFVTVSAPYDDTLVTLTFPPGLRDAASSERFVLQGVTYFPNDVITVTLDRLQTLQLQSTVDLTGMHINSSRVVAVLSGQNRSRVSSKGCMSHLLEQMTPTSHWARSFVLVHLPGQPADDRYRFIAKEAWTTVALAGGAVTLKIQEAGGFAQYDLAEEHVLFARADKPVLAVQYTLEQKAPTEHAGDPAMATLPSWEHARDQFYVATDPGSKVLHVVITALSRDAGSLTLNGAPLLNDSSPARNVTWRAVNGSSKGHVVVEVVLGVEDVPVMVGESGGPLMLVSVYFAEKCECWAMALTHGEPLDQGQDQSSNCSAPPSVAGDGIDNDCDQAVDEEPCYINSDPQDADGDQYKNEDCASEDDPKCLDSSGKEYSCRELQKWSLFSEDPDSRRLADGVEPLQAVSKITCAATCARTPGCWGTNFDPEGRESHRCELLSGWGRGMLPAPGWGFHAMKPHTIFSRP